MEESRVKVERTPRPYFVMLNDEQLKEAFNKKAEEYKNTIIRILDTRRLRWQIKLGMVKPEESQLTVQQLWGIEQKLSRRALKTLDEINDILNILVERQKRERRKRKTSQEPILKPENQTPQTTKP